MLWRVLCRLASLKLTLVILLLLGIGVVVSYKSQVRTTWALVVPLALFAVNLTSAVLTKPVFRQQRALLVFHLALITIILLVAAGRLTYLKGTLEVGEGEWFDGTLTSSESGPWHWWRVDRVSFVNEGFSIDYAPGVRRGKTVNRVRWRDEDGAERSGVIGDLDALVLHGYRFYTSPNKGFAPTFSWHPHGGQATLGTIHLPGYPLNLYRQALEWTPPGSRLKLWTMLQFDEVILDPAKPSEFRLPKEYRIVMRSGDERWEMQPGESRELGDGTLVYEGLRAWMGYTVYSDWTIRWLLAACVVAVLSLARHFWKKFAAKPWQA